MKINFESWYDFIAEKALFRWFTIVHQATLVFHSFKVEKLDSQEKLLLQSQNKKNVQLLALLAVRANWATLSVILMR